MTEEELINDIVKGNKESFEKIFEKYKNYSFKVSIYVLKNEDDALDNVNNAWIKIYTALTNNKFNFKSKFSTWIYRILLNEALISLKTRKKEISIDTAKLGQEKFIDMRPYINNVEDEVEQKERISKIMKLLNPRQQQIVRALMEGYKFKEIAKNLKIKPNHLYQLISRIKESLKDL